MARKSFFSSDIKLTIHPIEWIKARWMGESAHRFRRDVKATALLTTPSSRPSTLTAGTTDPGDRETWLYRECDICFRPACEKHSTEIEGRIICDRCRRGLEAERQPLVPLDVERLSGPR